MRYGDRVVVVLVFCAALWSGGAALAHADAGCALDMNGNGIKDAAFLVRDAKGSTLAVLVGHEGGFVTHSIPAQAADTVACRVGDTVWGRGRGASEPALHGTGGGYVLLSSADGPDIVFLLRKGGVRRVELADAVPPEFDRERTLLEEAWGD